MVDLTINPGDGTRGTTPSRRSPERTRILERTGEVCTVVAVINPAPATVARPTSAGRGFTARPRQAGA